MNEESPQCPLEPIVSHQQVDALFADYPQITPGRIGWGTLFQIIEWEQRHEIGRVSKDTVREYRDEGYSPAQAGLELGLIDYPQATGCEESDG